MHLVFFNIICLAHEVGLVTTMTNTIIGTKLKMTQTFVGETRVPVTVVKAGPCVVTQVKTDDTDGYLAIQLGMDTKKAKSHALPQKGHFKQKDASKDTQLPKFLREVRLTDNEYKVGDVINLDDIFAVGDTIRVTGVSKGKGFQGGVKRWGFAGGAKTHGQSDRHRAPGSIGQGTTPGRVWKGKKMAGRMGGDTITIKNLKVVGLDKANNELHISGPIPGTVGTLLMIRRISEKQENVQN